MKVNAYAENRPGAKFKAFEYELGQLKPDEVDINIKYCGFVLVIYICGKMNWVKRDTLLCQVMKSSESISTWFYGHPYHKGSTSRLKMEIEVLSDMRSVFERSS